MRQEQHFWVLHLPFLGSLVDGKFVKFLSHVLAACPTITHVLGWWLAGSALRGHEWIDQSGNVAIVRPPRAFQVTCDQRKLFGCPWWRLVRSGVVKVSACELSALLLGPRAGKRIHLCILLFSSVVRFFFILVVRWCEFSMCQSVLIVQSIHSCDSSFRVHSDVYTMPHHPTSVVTKKLRLFWLKIEFMCHKNTSCYRSALFRKPRLIGGTWFSAEYSMGLRSAHRTSPPAYWASWADSLP